MEPQQSVNTTVDRAKAMLGNAYDPKSADTSAERLQEIASQEFVSPSIRKAVKPIPQISADVIGTEDVQLPAPTTIDVPEVVVPEAPEVVEPTTPEAPTTIADMGDQALLNYIASATGGFQLSEEAQELQTEAAEAQKIYRDLTTQMTQYNKETKDEVYRLQQNRQAMGRTALQAEEQNYKYERYARPGGAADMAIEAQFALNNAQYAYELANNAVSAERDAYDSQLQAFKDIYTLSRNDMTTSEQLAYQSQLALHEQEVTSFMSAKEEALQMAALNNADAETIKAIKNATNVGELYEAGGQIAVVDQLERQMLRSKLADAALSRKATLFSMALEGSQEAIDELGYDPRTADVALDQTALDVNNIEHTRNQEAQNIVNRVAINERGINALTGLTTAPGIGGFFAGAEREVGDLSLGGLGAQIPGISNVLGAKQSIEAARSLTKDLAYVTKNLTLDRFQELKAAGASFGALSEGEWTIIGGSASLLDNMIVWEDETKTKIKYINGTAEEIQGALNTIQTQYKAAEVRLNRSLLPAAESSEIENEYNTY